MKRTLIRKLVVGVIALTTVMTITSCQGLIDAVLGVEDNPAQTTKPVSSDEQATDEETATVTVATQLDGQTLSTNYALNSLISTDNESGSHEINVLKEDEKPQLIFATNENDNIILMAKESFSDNKNVVINEETTALALITTHPMFVGITQDEFDEIVNQAKKTSAYSDLVEKVKESILNEEDAFDVTNSGKMVALNNVLEELCSNSNVVALTRAANTRASEVQGIVSDPVSVTTSGKSVIIKNRGLVPTYELQVYHGARMMDLGSNNMITSRRSYGIIDLLNDNVHFGDYGDPCEIVLSEEGEYRFYLDNTTEKAQRDLRDRMLNDALSIVGLAVDTETSNSNALNFIANAGVDVFKLMTDPDTRPEDWVRTVSLWTGQAGFMIHDNVNWRTFGRVLGKVMVVYNALKGAGNEIARIRMGFTAPHFVDFCLCQYDGSITSCTESAIEKVSGDNQEGFAKQRLLLPLVVSTKVFADDGSTISHSTYQKVKFEVVSGGGSVSNEVASTLEDNTSSTYWTLGESGEQKVKAVVVDMVTGVEVSEPVYFEATVRESADLTIRLDWNKLSGNTDIDLHVTDPYGEEIAFYHMQSQSGGWLDRDDVIGPGPEHVYWTTAPAGDYLVQVHYYYSETKDITTYSVNVNVGGQHFGPFRGSIADQQLITIGTLSLPNGTFTASSTRSEGNDIPKFIERKSVLDDIVFPFKKWYQK